MRISQLVLSFCLVLPSFAFAHSENQSAEAKQKALWQNIVESSYKTQLPDITSPGAWDALSLLSADFDSKAFSHDGDQMIEGRAKLIHSFGTTALVSFVADDCSPFTGVFSGALFGLVRISLAVPPVDGSTPKLVPGLALKFFVDGKASLNVMAMPSLDGQSEKNIFAHSYTTNVAVPEWSFTGWLIEQRFASALGYVGQSDGNPRSLSLDEMAKVTSSGENVSTPLAPFALSFEPTKELRDLFETRSEDDFRARLEGHGAAIALFDVWAHESVDAPREIHIGKIWATSDFMASSYGDKTLFFKHPPVHTWSQFP